MDNCRKIKFINRMDDFFNLLLKQSKALLAPMYHENKLNINGLSDSWDILAFSTSSLDGINGHFSSYTITFPRKALFQKRYVLLSVVRKTTSYF